MNKQTLVIAEKPSVAQSLAAVLGATKRINGCLTGNGYIVSWCIGHLVELSNAETYDKKYIKWKQSDLPILPNNWEFSKTADKQKQKQLDILKKLMNDKNVDSVICATDAGREAAIDSFVKTPFYTPVLDVWLFIATGEKSTERQVADEIRSSCEGKRAFVTLVKQQEKRVSPPKLYDLTGLQREANRIFGYTASQTLEIAQRLYEKKIITYPRTNSKFLTVDMAESLPTFILEIFDAMPFLSGIKKTINLATVIDNSKVSDHHAIIPTKTMFAVNSDSLLESERNILYMIATRLVSATHEDYIFSETKITLDCEGYFFTAKGNNDVKMGFKGVEMALKSFLNVNADDSSLADDSLKLPEISEGQIFGNVRLFVKEGFTSSPKKYTEDLLLASMETAGKEPNEQWRMKSVFVKDEMPKEAERKGLGTPATRAGIIEKLISTGFIERKNRNIIPTEKGKNLIAVLPDSVKSPALTAEDEFKQLFSEHPQADAIGTCMRCGSSVFENAKGYFCEDKSCGFALWKNNKFFSAKRINLDTKTATALLKEGRIFMSNLYSEKTGKAYDATIVLSDTGQYVNFKLEFEHKKAS